MIVTEKMGNIPEGNGKTYGDYKEDLQTRTRRDRGQCVLCGKVLKEVTAYVNDKVHCKVCHDKINKPIACGKGGVESISFNSNQYVNTGRAKSNED